MGPSRRESEERVFDIREKKRRSGRGVHTIKGLIYGENVVNLRPHFRFRHPWILAAIIVAVAAATFLGARNFLTKGEVKDFYAGTCLGSWQNPSAAAGIPETTLAASSSFSADNSAVYDVSGTQIYCGGFVPPDFSSSGTLNSVTLSLVWQVGDTPYVPPSTAASSTDEGVSSTVEDSSVDGGSSSVGEAPTPTGTDASFLATSTPTSTPIPTSTSLLDDNYFLAGFVKRAFAQDVASDSDANAIDSTGSADDSGGASSDAPDQATVTVSPDDQATTTAFAPAATSATDSGASDSTTVSEGASTTGAAATSGTDSTADGDSSTIILSPAPNPTFSADTSTASTTTEDASTTGAAATSGTDSTADGDSGDSSTIILGPPLIATLSADTSTASTTPATNDSTASDTDSVSVPSSTAPVIAPPPAPDDNFLEVSYSTDGQLWIQLAEVNTANWPDLTLALPITDWGDLQNLQIKIQGIPTTQDPVPPVYLDGMVIEADYDVSSDQQTPTSTYSQFLTDKTEYTIGDPINIVGAPPESFIEIYSLNDPNNPGVPENDYGIQINNLGQTVIDSNTLTAGDYILVNTFEPHECNEYSLTECEGRDDYISQVPISVFAN